MSPEARQIYDFKRVATLSRREGECLTPRALAYRQIRVLKTGAWYEAVRARQSLGADEALLAPFSLGKRLQPHTYHPGKAGYSTNSWSKYAAGLICPSQSTIEQVEEIASGTRAWIESPFWALFNCSESLHAHDGALRQLSPEIFDCVFPPGPRSRRVLRANTPQDLCLDALSCKVNGLEALAAAVWVLRDALQDGDPETCLESGAHLHSILLMATAFGTLFQIRYSLMAFFHRHVFPLAGVRGIIINPSLTELIGSADAFLDYMLDLEDDGVINYAAPGDSSQWLMMLDGSLGEDLLHGIGPHYELRPEIASPQEMKFVSVRMALRNWARPIIEARKRRKLPRDVRLQACGLR